jgi:O-antigen/teichoic acid export membrane protein
VSIYLKVIIKRILALMRSKAIWSFFDQGLVSLGNFITFVLLGRNLTLEDFAYFTLIYSVLVFLNSFHNGLIVYSLSVKGAVAEDLELREMTTNYVLLTIGLVGISSIVILIATVILEKIWIFPLATLAFLFWMIQETLRRALIAHLRYYEVVWGDVVSYLGQATAIWFLVDKKLLSVENIFLAIAITSILAALIQAIQIKLTWLNWQKFKQTVKVAWELGKWNLLSGFFGMITQHSPPWILAWFHGVPSTAAVQALSTIAGVSNPIIVGTYSVMLPTVAKAGREGGIKAVYKVVIKYALLGAILLMPFFGLMVFFPKTIIGFVYKTDSPFLNSENLLRLIVLGYVILYLSRFPTVILAGLEKSKSTFIGQIISTSSSVFVGIPLIITIGDWGIVLGTMLSEIMRIIINMILIRKMEKILRQNSQMFD